MNHETPAKSKDKSHNEFQLLGTRRFLPLFITQFLGAFNDNFFKTALIMLLAFTQTTLPFNQDTLINVCAALFILPFFLFSAFAGQLADKFEKSRLMRATKLVEVLLSLLAVLGFYWNNVYILLTSLFLLGTQAAFFGPLKYSILPQILKNDELLGGNGMIEMATFIAILIGTIAGGLLVAIPDKGVMTVSITMVIIALLGYSASFFIPKAKAYAGKLKIDWNLARQTYLICKESYRHPIIFTAIIGISWFWLFGSIIITQTPNFARLILSGNEHVATLLLTCFSIGIGIGSVSSEWLAQKKIVIGFVFVGLAGLTLFTFDFALTPYFSKYFSNHVSNLAIQNLTDTNSQIGALQFLSHLENWRILCDCTLMGIFGGIYMVPLYTLLQKKSSKEYRSRMIAANNILNAIFMVVAAIIAIVVLNLGFSIPQLFTLTAFLNILFGFYLIKLNHLMQRTPISV